MKKFAKTGLAFLLLLICMTITAFAVTPVVDVLSAEREKDGTITVVLAPADEYNIVEMRFASGAKDKSHYDSAKVISNGTITGLKTGRYTVFCKDADGNIGAYPLNVGEESESSASSTEESESWAEEESTEYGGSWIKWSVEAETRAPEPEKLTISKREIAKSEELPGAKLVIKDASGKTVDEWTSTKSPHVIDMLADGTYTLTEITAPKGYEVAETITFVITDGNVTSGNKYENHIVMYDAPSEPNKLTISKREIAKSEELPGAKLVIKDASGKTVDEWTSSDKPHVIDMLADGNYSLTEITAPKGYEVAETIQFVIKDGNVTLGDESDNHIVMYDAPSEPDPTKPEKEDKPKKDRDPDPEPTKKQEEPGVVIVDGPPEPSTQAPTSPSTEIETLPQTGGLDERMKMVLGVFAVLIFGGGLYLIGNKYSK